MWKTKFAICARRWPRGLRHRNHEWTLINTNKNCHKPRITQIRRMGHRTSSFVIHHFLIIRVIRAIRGPVSWHLTRMPYNIRVYSCPLVVKA